MKIRIFEAFAGYGSQSIALQRLKEDYPGFDYEVAGFSEIDRFAFLITLGVCESYRGETS